MRIEPIPAARGLILDRNGEVIAGNQPAYQLELVPEQVPDLDRRRSTASWQLGLIRAEDVPRLKRTIRSRRSFDSVPVRLRMSEEDIARFAVRRFEFPGVDIKTRQTRCYPNGELAVHALGYVGAISEQDLKHIDRAAYAGTSLIGKLGVESAYEPQLHGTNGFREVLVNAQGRSVERQGALRAEPAHQAAHAGRRPDARRSTCKVQRVAEEALGGQRGAVVAIDPKNGDVLALVSRRASTRACSAAASPRAEYARAAATTSTSPLFNRALRGTYPPGSTIKPAHRARRPRLSRRGSRHGTQLLPRRLSPARQQPHVPRGPQRAARLRGPARCHRATPATCISTISPNMLGVDRIAAFLAPFGFGKPTGIDIGGEKSGPAALARVEARRRSRKPADQVWFPGETVNFGIGQGYFLVTPLQLAHYASMLANARQVWQAAPGDGLRDPRTGADAAASPRSRSEEVKRRLAEQWQRRHGRHGGDAARAARRPPSPART